MDEDFISSRCGNLMDIEVDDKSGSWTFISGTGSGKSDSASFRTCGKDISCICKSSSTIGNGGEEHGSCGI